MTSQPDYPALEARLDFVHARMLELQSRVVSLEARVHGPVAVAPVVTPPSNTPPARSWQPPPRPSQPPLQAWQPPAEPTRPTADEPAEEASEGLVRVLAVAGGGALLLGLGFFVAYAIEQNWLTPSIRFVLAAIASALLTVAAWPIAKRGYEAVAGAIGGAGLGGWFAAWLVARHVHELVAAPQTFAALAVGAAACLLIADRLRLRLMAGLATVAACATPVLVASGGGRLHELMIYQLLVIVGLVILDARRRWPELPTIGLLATWLLGGAWADAHLQHANAGGFVAWSAVLLLVSAVSGWRLITNVGDDDLEQGLIHVRLVIAGLACWAASAAAFGFTSPAFAAATALLSVWHIGLAVFLRRRELAAGEMFLGLGWLQAFVFGPVALVDAMLAWWWIGLSVTATVVPWFGLQRMRGLLQTVPALAAVGWSVAADQPWSLFVGLIAAAALLGASLWPDRHATHERPVPWLAMLGTLAWTTVVLVHGPTTIVGRLCWGLVPVVGLMTWAAARPTRQAQLVASIQLGLGLFGAAVTIADAKALDLQAGANASTQLGLAVLLLGLAALAAVVIARLRATARLDVQQNQAPNITGLGLMLAGAGGLALLLGVAALTKGSVALGQVGYSLSVAVVGLGLIVAGLRLHDTNWRLIGLALIATAAGKIVLFDLAAAAVGWRALSFIGLGGVLIAGAFAYSRACRRAVAPT